jgi:hypothetical protein
LCFHEKGVNKRCENIIVKNYKWTKKSEKGRKKWAKNYKDSLLCLQKLKTHVKTIFAFKAILFKETLEFKDAINLCYSR